ncbi:4-hydroxy-tetrahydrodipicolinate reductase [Prolixibacteraceae bacterium JC049]|nr:4-hydroxy-tetrahydrodipicolinate reductase [Prolixibacteraceae bacterium JC049]
MKIALIGYGKMGKEIEAIALSRGHEVVLTIDVTNPEDSTIENLQKADVAIEFTRPESAKANYLKCFEAGVPVVSGTTGWLNDEAEVKTAMANNNGTFFYASNFSLGVNLFFELNKKLAKLMNGFNEYQVSMEETHHTQKLDAPSGTAITLAEDLIEELDQKTEWKLANQRNENELVINPIRRGFVPGIHTITYESLVDTITISHSAKSRQGFALGAVLAAEFAQNNKGWLGMKDLLNI